MYQHDIDPKLLAEKLKGIVESAVNTVGVDVNTASPSLLSYVSGLSPYLAQTIVEHRILHGDFVNREQVLDVHHVQVKTFQQCAGFLRIIDGNNALDNTSVHPESYHVIHRLLEIFIPDRMVEEDVSREDLAHLQAVLTEVKKSGEDLNLEHLAEAVHVGVPTLKDIIENMLAPGRDIRGQCATSSLKWTDDNTIEKLQVGDRMLGTVKNVVAFGAFVDISIGVTGLVHVSQMRTDPDAYAQWIDPHDVCKVGDKLSVEVVSVDRAKERVSLKIVEHELDL